MKPRSRSANSAGSNPGQPRSRADRPADRSAAARERLRRAPGSVWLIGAGPGDPELLTLRAARLLAEADVVLYDRLVGPEILRLAQESNAKATLVPVGKKPGRPGALRQDRINRLLIRYARAGFRVARLKGGDPFVFGRGGEEVLALAEAGVDYEVVPGVSSFSAAPALAGIPLTHRGLSAGFGVFTGHEADPRAGAESSGVPWETAARLPTAVFLMGVGNLGRIAQRLMEHGRDPQTPAAVIARASLPGERAVLASLATIAAAAEAAQLSNPAALVVGETAALALQAPGRIAVYSDSGAQADAAEEELELALRGELA